MPFLCAFALFYSFSMACLVLVFAGQLCYNTSSVTSSKTTHFVRVNNFFFCKTLDIVLSL